MRKCINIYQLFVCPIGLSIAVIPKLYLRKFTTIPLQFLNVWRAFSARLKTQVQKDWASARQQEELTIAVAGDELNFFVCDAIGELDSVITSNA